MDVINVAKTDKAYDLAYSQAVKSNTLTTCQIKATKEIWDWAVDENAIAWTLTGSAGTGKSFLTKIIKDLVPFRRIAITAPTHKAKAVASAFTQMRGETIHKLLGLRPNLDLENLDIRRLQFDPQAEPTINAYDCIFIDEASMINSVLFDLIMEQANYNGTKILFIGDPLQLPPVGEFISRVFTDTSGVSELLVPARQSIDNPLYCLLTALRSDIDGTDKSFDIFEAILKSFKFGDKFNDIVLKSRGNLFKTIIANKDKSFVDDRIGFQIMADKNEFSNIVLSHFNTAEFDNDINYCRFTSYRNSVIKGWNDFIRKSKIKSEHPIAVDDLLMSYTTVYNELMQPLVVNSEEYKVTKADLRTASITVLEGGYPTSYEFNYYETLLKSNNSLEELSNNIIASPFGGFAKVHNYYHKEGIEKRRWRQYYTFKNQYLIPTNLNEVLGKEYGQFPNKDIDYAYGITVHKSQGSTYKNCFVNLGDIREHSRIAKFALEKKEKRTATQQEINQINLITLKLAYVALSRASEKVFAFM